MAVRYAAFCLVAGCPAPGRHMQTALRANQALYPLRGVMLLRDHASGGDSGETDGVGRREDPDTRLAEEFRRAIHERQLESPDDLWARARDSIPVNTEFLQALEAERAARSRARQAARRERLWAVSLAALVCSALAGTLLHARG